MINLLYISSFLFALYVLYIRVEFGVQKSISWSFTILPRTERWMFRGVIWLLCSAIISFYEYSSFFVASGILLSLVGLFAEIKTAWKKVIHMIGAVGGILSAYAGVYLCDNILGLQALLITIVASLLVYIFKDKNNIVWSDEIICFIVVIISLILISNFHGSI